MVTHSINVPHSLIKLALIDKDVQVQRTALFSLGTMAVYPSCRKVIISATNPSLSELAKILADTCKDSDVGKHLSRLKQKLTIPCQPETLTHQRDEAQSRPSAGADTSAVGSAGAAASSGVESGIGKARIKTSIPAAPGRRAQNGGSHGSSTNSGVQQPAPSLGAATEHSSQAQPHPSQSSSSANPDSSRHGNDRSRKPDSPDKASQRRR
jgi:hypothetical protein